jgi:hypothetical protein
VILRRQIVLGPGRRPTATPQLPTLPGEPVDGFVATGDQALANRLALGSTGLGRPMYLGISYAPKETISSFGSNIGWLSLGGGNIHANGPSDRAPCDGTITQLIGFCRGSGTAASVRYTVHTGNGNERDYHQIYVPAGSSTGRTESIDAGARPLTARGASAEFAIASSAGQDWRAQSVNLALSAGEFIYLGVWPSATVSFLNFTGSMNANRYSAAVSYSASGALANFPGSSSNTSRAHIALFAVFVPAVAQPAGMAAVANGDRSVALSCGPVAGAERYRWQRQVGGGAWETCGYTLDPVHRDRDVATAGAVVNYRVSAQRQGGEGLPSTQQSVTITGVRVATITITPAARPATARYFAPIRGLDGAQTTVSGETQLTRYDRGVYFDEVKPTNSTPPANSPTPSAVVDQLQLAGSTRRPWICWRGGAPNVGNRLGSDWPETERTFEEGAWYPDNSDYACNEAGTGRLQRMIKEVAQSIYQGSRLFEHPLFRTALIEWPMYKRYGEAAGPGPDWSEDRLKWLYNTWLEAFPYNTFTTPTLQEEDVQWYVLTHPSGRMTAVNSKALGNTGSPSDRAKFDYERSIRVRHIHRGYLVPPGNNNIVTKYGEHFARFADDETAKIILAYHDTNRSEISMIKAANVADVDGLTAANRQWYYDSFNAAGYRVGVTLAQVAGPIARGQASPVKLVWVNRGNSPVHDNRVPVITLRNQSTGAVVASATSGINLRRLPPARWQIPADTLSTPIEITQDDAITVASSVAPGTYNLCVEVPALTQGIPFLPLDITNALVSGTGAYILGGVQVI